MSAALLDVNVLLLALAVDHGGRLVSFDRRLGCEHEGERPMASAGGSSGRSRQPGCTAVVLHTKCCPE